MAIMILTAGIANGQSKKNQIESLTHKIDSLIEIRINERQVYETDLTEKKKRATTLINQLDSLTQIITNERQDFKNGIQEKNTEVSALNNKIDHLNTNNNALSIQLNQKEEKIDSISIALSSIQNEKDSLDKMLVDNKETELLSLFSGKKFSRGVGETEEFIFFSPYEVCADAFIGSYWADGPSLKISTINFQEKELVLVGISNCINSMSFGYRLKYIDKNTISVKPMCCESGLSCDDAFFGFFDDLKDNPCNSFLLSN